MRLAISVRPGAARPAVGGDHDGALVVRVTEPPEGGRATEAARRAVADALSLPRRSVRVVRGKTSRRKLLDLDVAADDRRAVETELASLLSGSR